MRKLGRKGFMKYQSGEEVQVGDLVLVEKGRTLGTVEVIIETPEQAADWGLDPEDMGI
jgi:hypothetical protein